MWCTLLSLGWNDEYQLLWPDTYYPHRSVLGYKIERAYLRPERTLQTVPLSRGLFQYKPGHYIDKPYSDMESYKRFYEKGDYISEELGKDGYLHLYRAILFPFMQVWIDETILHHLLATYNSIQITRYFAGLPELHIIDDPAPHSYLIVEE